MGGGVIEEEIEKLQRRWCDYYEHTPRPDHCVFCQGRRVSFNGSRKRTVSVLVLTVVVYFSEMWCRRAKCARCRKSWTLRPPELVAHKHFQLCVVAHALSDYLFEPDSTLTGVGSQHNCSRKTVKRWLCWTAQIAQPAIVLHKVVKETGVVGLPRFPGQEG